MVRRSVPLALLTLLAALLALPATAPAADETTQQGIDVAHTGAVPDSPLQPPLRLRWRADLGMVQSNVLATGGRVIYVRGQRPTFHLTALAAADGHVLWSQEVPEGTLLAADGGRLFTVSDQQGGYPDGLRVRALDPATGNEHWRRDLTSEYGPGAAPTAAGGQLFVIESSGSELLYGLRQSDGANLWSPRSLSSGHDSTPALDADSVYVSVAGHHTYAFRRSDGAQRWHSAGCCSGGGGMPPIVHGGRVYGYEGLVHAASDGSILGTYGMGTPPTFSGDHGAEVGGGKIRGFGPDYATTRWTVDLGWFQAWSRPLVAGPNAYVSGGDNQPHPDTLMAVRLGDGNTVWCTRPEIPAGSEFPTHVMPVAIGDGLLLVSVGYGLAAFESGGEPSACAPRASAAPPPGGTGPPTEPPLGTVAGPTLTMKVGRRKLFVGRRTRVVGRLSGLPSVAGQAVAIGLDDWPFDDRYRPAARARTSPDGTVAFSLAPRFNVRVRLRLVSDATVSSEPQTVWAELRGRLTRIGGGGPNPRLRVTIFAPRRAQIRRKVVHGYVRGPKAWRRVAGRRWQRRGRRTVSVTLRYPPGRLGRRDRALICTRELVPDPYGEPSAYDRICGDRLMPRGLD